jgi:heme exporter protein CcmD
MREALDPWFYVNAAYALTIAATLALVAWSWWAMRTAERRREKARK